MKVIFADTTHPSLMERLINAGYQCWYAGNLNASNAPEVLADAQGLVIRSRIRLDAVLLDRLPNLKWIARVGAGMENIDVLHARKMGIVCLHAPEGNRNAVAEHALGMLLALMNNLNRADRELRQGIWRREENRGHELAGRTVGLIGFGNTGSSLARILSGFNVRILAYDKYITGFSGGNVEESDMDMIYRQADILSLHVPLAEDTRYLVNLEMLRRFQKPIYLINTSRGQCVDTAGLLMAIQEGLVTGAALDVLEFESSSFEQLSGENSTLSALLKSEKVLLSPHIAGWTYESNQKMADVLFEKILKLRG